MRKKCRHDVQDGNYSPIYRRRENVGTMFQWSNAQNHCTLFYSPDSNRYQYQVILITLTTKSLLPSLSIPKSLHLLPKRKITASYYTPKNQCILFYITDKSQRPILPDCSISTTGLFLTVQYHYMLANLTVKYACNQFTWSPRWSILLNLTTISLQLIYLTNYIN